MLNSISKKPIKKTKVTPAQTKNLRAKMDIIDLILHDHKPLKPLIKIMKDTEKPISERRKAFREFCPLLISHAKPEEAAWYAQMKKDDMREEAYEGDVEHGLAEQMVDEAMRTKDENLWSARVKVLAELVEHHIQEEEQDILPSYRKNSDPSERELVALIYQEAKKNIKVDGSEKDPKLTFEDESNLH